MRTLLVKSIIFAILLDDGIEGKERTRQRVKGAGRKRKPRPNKTTETRSKVVWRGPAPKPGTYPKSCHEIFETHAKECKKPQGGFFAIQPSSALKPKYAECIFDDERGWTVIQNRYAGEVCFNRDWDEYRMGFGCPVGVGKVPEWYNENADATQNGKVPIPKENTSMCPKTYTSPFHDDKGGYDPDSLPNTYRGPNPRRTDMLPECNGELWLGLEYMFWVQRSHGRAGTKLCSYIAADRTSYQYVCYDKFMISGWKDLYQIKSVDGFDIDLEDIDDGFRDGTNGTFGKNDLLGAKFSTADRDNDSSSKNCAGESNSGWWFKDCTNVNLNGLYHGSQTHKQKYDVKTGNPIHPVPADGMFWEHSTNKWDSLRQSKMFIAPVEVKDYPCMYSK